MKHELKIEQKYLIRILTGQKKFEVRVNDRDYQIGDEIVFLPLSSEDYNAYHYAPKSGIPSFGICEICSDR